MDFNFSFERKHRGAVVGEKRGIPKGNGSKINLSNIALDYLYYYPKPLDSTHPSYTIFERILNIQHALGARNSELCAMLGVCKSYIRSLRTIFPAHAVERRLARLEYVFAEELRYYLHSPKTHDQFYLRYEIHPIRQQYGGYKIKYKARRHSNGDRARRRFYFWNLSLGRPYPLSIVQTMEDVEALRRAKRTEWYTKSQYQRINCEDGYRIVPRPRPSLDRIAAREATYGGFVEIVESRSECGAYTEA